MADTVTPLSKEEEARLAKVAMLNSGFHVFSYLEKGDAKRIYECTVYGCKERKAAEAKLRKQHPGATIVELNRTVPPSKP